MTETMTENNSKSATSDQNKTEGLNVTEDTKHLVCIIILYVAMLSMCNSVVATTVRSKVISEYRK